MEKDGKTLTHINEAGEAHMVDVGTKDETIRVAEAQGFIEMRKETLALILEGKAAKGDVLATARIAGIMAAKKTSDLIPLCHPIALTSVTIELVPQEGPDESGVAIVAIAKTRGRTGVEMEALTAASVAALTIYDMCKAVDRGMTICHVELAYKAGGASGVYKKEGE